MQQRNIGMTINHQEIEHILRQMTDVLRNAAYHVANAKFPVGNQHRDQYFDPEDGKLTVMDEDSIRALLKDALDHYLMFNAVGRQQANFDYYLGDSFTMVRDYIYADPQKLNYLTCLFGSACGILASTLAPVVEDLSISGHVVEKIESFTLNAEESYYLVSGENPESPDVPSYDPKEDDLSSVVLDDTPEALAEWELFKSQLMFIEEMAEKNGGTYERGSELWSRSIPPMGQPFNGIKCSFTPTPDEPISDKIPDLGLV